MGIDFGDLTGFIVIAGSAAVLGLSYVASYLMGKNAARKEMDRRDPARRIRLPAPARSPGSHRECRGLDRRRGGASGRGPALLVRRPRNGASGAAPGDQARKTARDSGVADCCHPERQRGIFSEVLVARPATMTYSASWAHRESKRQMQQQETGLPGFAGLKRRLEGRSRSARPESCQSCNPVSCSCHPEHPRGIFSNVIEAGLPTMTSQKVPRR